MSTQNQLFNILTFDFPSESQIFYIFKENETLIKRYPYLKNLRKVLSR